MTPRSFWKTAAPIALGAFAVIAALNWRFYFATPMLEQGDIAGNALQVHQAKHGTALYGNYSRFFFYHPGPAFFYVYAAGERVFRDWLGATPSAHNAHSLAGLMLQCGFFAAGLTLFAQRFRLRLFLPIALFLAAAHFGLARGAFTSVWPPHVLLMPFFCFFAACVSVASGRGRHLPLAVLAGCFLVHGHVAQPLFVVSLFGLAYALLWRGARRIQSTGSPWRNDPGPHWAAAGIAALFLLPLAIDWLRWPDDNMYLILHSLTGNSGGHKDLWKSLLYFLSFFAYAGDYDTWIPERGAPGLGFLAEHAGWYLAWLALFALLAASWRRLSAALDGEGRRFLRNTLRFWLAACGLGLVWGVIQTGPMFPFNAFFFYALLFIPLLAAAAAMTADGRLLGGFIALGAVAVAGRAFAVGLPNRAESGIPLLEAGQALLKADPAPRAPKVLVFSHDDWPGVISVGLLLDRSNVPFSVDPNLGATGLMFGRAHWLKPPYVPDPGRPPSVWRFLRRAPAGAGLPFPGGLQVAFSPGRLDPAGASIDMGANGNFEQYVLAGFTTPGGSDAPATTLPEAEWDAVPGHAEKDPYLVFSARPFLSPPRIASQPMELWVNGVKVGAIELSRPASAGKGEPLPWRDVGYRVPAEVWNRYPVARFVMKFPAARSPAQLGINNDPRVLGWEIRAISVVYSAE